MVFSIYLVYAEVLFFTFLNFVKALVSQEFKLSIKHLQAEKKHDSLQVLAYSKGVQQKQPLYHVKYVTLHTVNLECACSLKAFTLDKLT